MFPALSGAKLVIICLVVVAFVGLFATCAVLHARLGEKDAQIASLTDQLTIAAADAKRWQDAAGQRQGVIDRQQQQIRQLESDGAAARRVAAEKADLAQRRVATLSAQLTQLKEAAHDRPDDVKALGPIVRGLLGSLRHDTLPAGADPSVH